MTEEQITMAALHLCEIEGRDPETWLEAAMVRISERIEHDNVRAAIDFAKYQIL